MQSPISSCTTHPDPAAAGSRILVLMSIILCACSHSADTSSGIFPLANEQNMDARALEWAYERAGRMTSIRSLLVSRNATLIAEQYFNGGHRDSAQEVRSVTKSITSLLIGIAIDKGILPDVNTPMGEIWPNETGALPADKYNISLEHLLTMSGGFAWPSFGDWSEYSNFRNAPNQVTFILSKPIVDQPGTRFQYNDGASHLLSVILSGTGNTTRSFAQQYLFDPLKMGRRVWTEDKQGYPLGCVGVFLTSRDMVAIGEMMLTNGVYRGSRIVSGAWVTATTASHISTGNVIPHGSHYGYLWWVDEVHGQSLFMATGWGGQFIVCVPALHLVVVATCEWRNVTDVEGNANWDAIATLLFDFIIPSAH